MVLWYNVLDVATITIRYYNLHQLHFTVQLPDYVGGVANVWRLIIKELAKELVVPHMKCLMEGTLYIKKHITEAVGNVG